MSEVYEMLVAVLMEQGHTREEAEKLVQMSMAFSDEIAEYEEELECEG